MWSVLIYIVTWAEESYQIYDISSEEENTNDDDHSDCETPTLPQEEISDQSAYISTMATVFKTMFEEKPVKKGWAKKNTFVQVVCFVTKFFKTMCAYCVDYMTD